MTTLYSYQAGDVVGGLQFDNEGAYRTHLLYYAVNSNIYVVDPYDSTTTSIFYTNPVPSSNIKDVAIGGGYIFWTDRDFVYRAPIDGNGR